MNPNISAKVVRAYAKSRRAHRTIERIARNPEVPGGIPNSFLAADALADLESAAADLREFLEVPKTYVAVYYPTTPP